MSTSDNNSNLLNQTCESGTACPLPAVPKSAESQTTRSLSIVPQAADVPARPKKSALLPEIARLSLEGHSNRAIGRKLGIPARTVDRWVGQLRQQWGDNSAQNSAELHAIAMARLETVYREAMEAWRNSLEVKQTTVEPLGSEDAKKKGSLRKTTQSGQAAMLSQALRAALEIAKFNVKHIYSSQQLKKTENAPTRR